MITCADCPDCQTVVFGDASHCPICHRSMAGAAWRDTLPKGAPVVPYLSSPRSRMIRRWATIVAILLIPGMWVLAAP